MNYIDGMKCCNIPIGVANISQSQMLRMSDIWNGHVHEHDSHHLSYWRENRFNIKWFRLYFRDDVIKWTHAKPNDRPTSYNLIYCDDNNSMSTHWRYQISNATIPFQPSRISVFKSSFVLILSRVCVWGYHIMQWETKKATKWMNICVFYKILISYHWTNIISMLQIVVTSVYRVLDTLHYACSLMPKIKENALIAFRQNSIRVPNSRSFSSFVKNYHFGFFFIWPTVTLPLMVDY